MNDDYEYSVQLTDLDTGKVRKIDFWYSLEKADHFLNVYDLDATTRKSLALPVFFRYSMVKRRKAGKVERV